MFFSLELVPQVKPEIAFALYGVRFFHAIVAMFQAAHNCDYYITKYQGKSMENLLKKRKMHIDRLVANGDERVPPGLEGQYAALYNLQFIESDMRFSMNGWKFQR